MDTATTQQLIRNTAAEFRTDDMDASNTAVLRSYAEMQSAFDRDLRAQVDAARSLGCSWQEIGDALGISRQAAHERFTKGR